MRCIEIAATDSVAPNFVRADDPERPQHVGQRFGECRGVPVSKRRRRRVTLDRHTQVTDEHDAGHVVVNVCPLRSHRIRPRLVVRCGERADDLPRLRAKPQVRQWR